MKIKLVLAAFALLLGVGNAATVTLGGSFSLVSGLGVQTSGGSVLANGGYYIAVGSYSGNIVPTLQPDNSNLFAVVDAMNVFASGTSATSGNTMGAITGSFVSTGGTTAELWNGQRIFVVVGNGADRASSTEFAIVSVSTTINGATYFNFPNPVTGTGATSPGLSQVGNVVTHVGAEIDSPVGSRDLLQLAAVPEPSTALLGAFGVLGLLRRRRR